MVGRFDQPDREPLRDAVDQFLPSLAAKAEHRHVPLHLIEAVGMLIVLVVQQKQAAVQPFVPECNPLRRGDISFMVLRQRTALASGPSWPSWPLVPTSWASCVGSSLRLLRVLLEQPFNVRSSATRGTREALPGVRSELVSQPDPEPVGVPVGTP